MLSPGLIQQSLGRIKAHRLDAEARQHPAKTPLAAADVERPAKASPSQPLADHRVEHVLPTVVAMLAHVGDPGRGGVGPAVRGWIVGGRGVAHAAWIARRRR
jgi:hypothetical protein